MLDQYAVLNRSVLTGINPDLDHLCVGFKLGVERLNGMICVEPLVEELCTLAAI